MVSGTTCYGLNVKHDCADGRINYNWQGVFSKAGRIRSTLDHGATYEDSFFTTVGIIVIPRSRGFPATQHIFLLHIIKCLWTSNTKHEHFPHGSNTVNAISYHGVTGASCHPYVTSLWSSPFLISLSSRVNVSA